MIEANIKERYDSLDGLRAFACIGIVLMHVKANIDIKPTGNFLINNIISFTGNFVFLFMTISAFALSCGYFEEFKNGSVKLFDFYKKRYTRILPFFALLTLIDVIKTIIEEHFYWTDALQGELWEAFANITLAFGLIPENDISVIGVGWFLGVIFLFYMLFPFFVFILDCKRRAWITLGIVVLLYFSVLFYFHPVKGTNFGNNSFMHCAPFFVVGGLAYLYREKFVYLSMLFRWILRILTIGYTVWFFVFPEMRFTLSNLVMYVLWLLYAVSEVSLKRITLLNNRVMIFFSGISMEIYLSHMMFFRIVEKLHLEKFILNNDINYCATCLLVFICTISFAWCWKKWGEPNVLKVIEN